MFPPNIVKSLSLRSLNALYSREMPHSDSSLAKAARYHFRNPGKSFRAQLALTSGKALGLNEQDNLHWAASCGRQRGAKFAGSSFLKDKTIVRGQP